jgi:hypothetical protein
VLLARSLELLGGELVALDGAFFHGDASKASILTKRRLEERMAGAGPQHRRVPCRTDGK